VDAFGALPLRVAAGKLLYLGFEDRIDPALALAVERITGLRVECGLVQGSLFRQAHARILSSKFPPAELIDPGGVPAIVQSFSKSIERARPAKARLVRAHDCLWLRMWQRSDNGAAAEATGVQDLIASIGTH
jgi:hypothetical protein